MRTYINKRVMGKGMSIKDSIGSGDKEVISIVGAGGKTSLMYALGEELKNKKVLLSTTTKILPPIFDEVDFYGIGQSTYLDISENMKSGSFLYANSLTKEGKVDSIPLEDIKKFKEDFDYIILESDGSKRKPLKGWKENEPVISEETTITIGVFDITTLNKLVNEDLVHRITEFLEISKAREEKVLKGEHIVNMIFNEEGLFKNSVGRKILFINKVESEENENVLKKLIDKINEKNKEKRLIERIVYGSIKSKKVKTFILKN